MRIVVLQSFPTPRETTNPYLAQLVRSAADGVTMRGFSWRTALFGRYDVLHLHWPEVLLRGTSRPRTALRRALFAAVLLRTRLSRIPVVRTLHNAQAHEAGPLAERLLVDLSQRWTTLWIRLNPSSTSPSSAPARTILHGHYTDWLAAHPQDDPVPGRLLYFGLVREYKGVEHLISTFALVPGSGLTLDVVGRPYTEALRRSLTEAAEGDERVTLQLEHVDDAALAREVGAAELVVLPYREMHNSGALLLALSLGRPALVPSSEVTAALAAEVGDDWVLTFDGDLEPADLDRALRRVRRPRTPAPDLSHRDWDTVAEAHKQAYLDAIAAVRPRRAQPAATTSSGRRATTRRPMSTTPATSRRTAGTSRAPTA